MGKMRGFHVQRLFLRCTPHIDRGEGDPGLGANVSRNDTWHGDGHERRRRPQRESHCAQRRYGR